MKNKPKGFIVPLLITIVGILLIGGGLYMYSQTKNQQVNTVNEIINQDSKNKAQFTGYYLSKTVGGRIPVEGGTEGEYVYVATSTCDSFVVLGGNESLINYFKDLIKIGNTINKLDEKGNLIVNIDMSNVDVSKKILIVNSNKTKPITIDVEKTARPDSGQNICWRDFKVAN